MALSTISIRLLNTYRGGDKLTYLGSLSLYLTMLLEKNFFFIFFIFFHDSTWGHFLLSRNQVHRWGKSRHCLFFSFSKTLDTVFHNVLVLKLAHYGQGRWATRWRTKYLDELAQKVVVNRLFSITINQRSNESARMSVLRGWRKEIVGKDEFPYRR